MPKYWNPADVQIVKDYYNIISANEIRKRYLPHKSVECIRYMARMHGIKGSCGIRKYEFDREFFTVPNIVNNYYAGYLAADGYILRDGGVGACCKIDDIELLENFTKNTNSTYPLTFRKRSQVTGFKDERIYFRKPNARFKIRGAFKWIENLKLHWNIGYNKSLTLQPPNITNPEQIAAYIIGYFDGDGYISQNSKRFEMGFSSGSKDILDWIHYNTQQFVPNIKWKDRVRKGHNGYCISWTRKKAILIHKFYRNYVDIPFKLRRKWEIEYN